MHSQPPMVIRVGVTVRRHRGEILGGVFFEALFFCACCFDVKATSVPLALTGFEFVFATFAAIIFLGESVSVARCWL